jgi:uncharacterized lipoprotein YmbA
MMRMSFIRKSSTMVLFMAFLLVGCRSGAPPVEFYTLSSISDAEEKSNPAGTASNLAIGVGPVETPQVLDRPQIVTRSGPNKIVLDEFHRWAGPLQANFARVLAENISILLPTDRVAVYPWEVTFRPDYRVALDIRYFEGQWGNNVLLDVVWRVTDRADQNTLALKKSLITEPLPVVDYEMLVAAKSHAIARLSREIVQEIQQLQSGVKNN